MDVFSSLWLCASLFLAVQAIGERHSPTLSAPHRQYVCPVGANVTLTCYQSGSVTHPEDKHPHTWVFTSNINEHCHNGLHPRGTGANNRSLGVEYKWDGHLFSITLQNIKQNDQGRYCCRLLDIQTKKHKTEVEAHNYILLTVMPAHNGSLKCSELVQNSSEDALAEGLAIAACIAFILCLPLILMLVYRQRQAVGQRRRAHELVRMDSAQGHENAVFAVDSPEPKPRTVSQIMRQSSETGRHLLSDPGTPFSPIQGDVFFSVQEPIPESPNLLLD